jgi:hypothetical protein
MALGSPGTSKQTLNETVNIMNLAKVAIFLALGSLGAPAFAGEAPAAGAPVEPYTYSTELDIHKVIAVSDIPNACGPVPAQMTYEDSNGQRHVMQYQVMGTGCSNG